MSCACRTCGPCVSICASTCVCGCVAMVSPPATNWWPCCAMPTVKSIVTKRRKIEKHTEHAKKVHMTPRSLRRHSGAGETHVCLTKQTKTIGGRLVTTGPTYTCASSECRLPRKNANSDFGKPAIKDPRNPLCSRFELGMILLTPR